MFEEIIENEILYTISKFFLESLLGESEISEEEFLRIDKELLTRYQPYMEILGEFKKNGKA